MDGSLWLFLQRGNRATRAFLGTPSFSWGDESNGRGPYPALGLWRSTWRRLKIGMAPRSPSGALLHFFWEGSGPY